MIALVLPLLCGVAAGAAVLVLPRRSDPEWTPRAAWGASGTRLPTRPGGVVALLVGRRGGVRPRWRRGGIGSRVIGSRVAGSRVIGSRGIGSARVGATGPSAVAPAHPARVPEALELLALALLGGGSLSSAVSRVGAVLPGGVGADLSEVAVRLRRGMPGEEAWEGLEPSWEPAWRSLQLAEAAGVPPGQALGRAAQDLRRDAVADVEVAAAKLGIRLVVPLGLAFLPAFVLTTVLPLVLALMRDLSW